MIDRDEITDDMIATLRAWREAAHQRDTLAGMQCAARVWELLAELDLVDAEQERGGATIN